jgi:hypothetical protein
MEKIPFEQFVAEIETSLSNYAESNDIDRQSIKTWLIQALRKFGKNICERNETIVEVKNSRALLPETFKSLTIALKVETSPFEEKKDKQLVLERQYIENPAIWDTLTLSYVVDYCETKIVTEKVFANKENHVIYDIVPLSLEDHINKDTIDVNCFNILPSIRNNYPNRISITSRTLNTNFKEGFVYLKYNSLPQDDEGEIAIPVFTTGDLYNFIENEMKWRIAENLIANNKASQGLSQLYSTWKNESVRLFISAQAEAKFHGLKDSSWTRKFYKQTLLNRKYKGL